jgi:hypothetical protein
MRIVTALSLAGDVDLSVARRRTRAIQACGAMVITACLLPSSSSAMAAHIGVKYLPDQPGALVFALCVFSTSDMRSPGKFYQPLSCCFAEKLFSFSCVG